MTRRSLGGALRAVLAAAAVSSPAAAGELSHADRIAALWSGRFSFAEDGRPLVGLELGAGAVEVTVAASAGGRGVHPVRVWPDSPEGGTEIALPGILRIRALEARPAELAWLVVLESVPGDHPRGAAFLGERVAAWRARGVEPRIVERGAVFGVSGTTLDTRVRILTIPGHRDPVKAAALAAAAKERLGATGTIEPNVERPAGGLLELTAAAGAGGAPVRLVARDAIWFGGHGGGELLSMSADGKPAQLYRGMLYVTFDRAGRLLAGNALSAEEMLFGLVPAETFAAGPVEALKAQAVTARGTLLAKIGHAHSGQPFLLCSSTHCQVYAGAGRETKRTTEAVLATRGEVLFGKEGGLINTLYSASCGGWSENCENVWDKRPSPYLRGRLDAALAAATDPLAPFRGGIREDNLRAFLTSTPDTWCRRSSFEKGGTFRWKVVRSAAEVNAAVAKAHPALGRVLDVRVRGRGVSGRVTEVELVGEHAVARVARELPVRTLFGGLKSGLFVVDVARDAGDIPRAFTFTGGGYGHGVGMCQQGAMGMAEAGIAYGPILAHYYGGAKVRKLY